MSEFYEITELKWGPIQYRLNGYRNHYDSEIIENYCIAMRNHMFPLSVRYDEFEFLKNLIIILWKNLLELMNKYLKK